MANRNSDGTFISTFNITKKELNHLYWEMWMSVSKIATLKNVNRTTIIRKLNQLNIHKRNGNEIDMRNIKFGKLTGIKLIGSRNRRSIWLFKCDCGNKIEYSGCDVRNGHSSSCRRCDEIDLINKKFGKLKVFKTFYKNIKVRNKSVNRLFCEVMCECNKCTIVSAGHLKTGHTTSCGNMICNGLIEDLSGKQFCMLKVIEFSHTENGQSKWKCECRCGKIKVIGANTLKMGTTQSCGCCRNINETNLEDILKNIFPKFVIKRHYSTKFLKRQHLDFGIINDKECFLAIEYDGIQHFEAIEFFGGKKRFKEQQERDQRKNKIMADNIDKIKYFIRIPYWEDISEKNIIKILKDSGVNL